MNPLFSVIIPSYLGHYPTAAKNRDQKIIRAIDSVVDQSFKSWEAIIITAAAKKRFQFKVVPNYGITTKDVGYQKLLKSEVI